MFHTRSLSQKRILNATGSSTCSLAGQARCPVALRSGGTQPSEARRAQPSHPSTRAVRGKSHWPALWKGVYYRPEIAILQFQLPHGHDRVMELSTLQESTHEALGQRRSVAANKAVQNEPSCGVGGDHLYQGTGAGSAWKLFLDAGLPQSRSTTSFSERR